MLGTGKHAINVTNAAVYTQLLAHFNDLSMPPTDERGGSYTIVDAGQGMTIVDPKFGYRCLDNNGGTGYFTPGPGMSFDILTATKWTLEGWLYFSSADQPFTMKIAVVALEDDTGVDALFVTGDAGALYAGFVGVLQVVIGPGSGVPRDQWVHWAVSRDGDAFYGHQDGVPGEYGPGTYQESVVPTRLAIGRAGLASGAYPPPNNGSKLDEIRLTIGAARYGVGSFSPPSAPFTLD